MTPHTTPQRLTLALICIGLIALAACGDDGATDTADPNNATTNAATSTNSGTTSTNNGATSTNNGATTSTNGATTSTNGGTTSTNSGTTSTNNGTSTSTNNATTSTNNGTTSTNNGTTTPPAPRFEQLIRAAPYPRLVFELDAVENTMPRARTQDDIAGLMDELLSKPGGVEWVADETIPSRGPDYGWTLEDLGALTRQFNLDVPDDTIKIHVFYLDGHYVDDTDTQRVLGLAWNHTWLAIFKDTIDDLCAASTPLLADEEAYCAFAETAIVTHELGHLLGLVDNGLPMVTPHRDPNPDHGAHDVNDACVMYWAFESPQAFDNLSSLFLGGDSEPAAFDDACLADIAAVRDR